MTRLRGERVDDAAALLHADPMQGLAAKVAFLRRPGSYPEPAARVDAVEAHMSWVFLLDDYAYKLKKPFRRNGIDYSTAQLRHLNCRRELRLNRRLAPDIYLDVVALTVDARGHFGLGGRGRRVDSLVRMRRLPLALTLEARLKSGVVMASDARRIAARLVPFFAEAARARVTPRAYRRRLSAAIDAADAKLAQHGHGLDRSRIATTSAELRRFIQTRGELVDARARARRIVEGHGDLRPEHIYLTQPPTVMDCIEFDRRLRLRDPVEELAFLAMECDRGGCPQFDGWLFAEYRALSDDEPPRALVEFYKAYSAFSRARIAIWHLDDPDTGPRQHWIDCADDYLGQAARYLGGIARADGGGKRT